MLSAQSLGPQTLPQLRESPAGSKLITLIETANTAGPVAEYVIRELFSARLVEKLGIDGLRNLFADIRENDGTLTLYDAHRNGRFEYTLKLKSGNTGEWLDLNARFEETPPYGIDALGLDISEQPAETSVPILGAATAPVVVSEEIAGWIERAQNSRSPHGAVVITGELGARLDDYLQKQFEVGFSGAALVVREGKVVLHKGYGYADRENDRLNRPETVFSVGSITKDFTLAAILKLEENGQLSVGDRIGKYLDGVPADKEPITIHHLLTHQSGLHEYHDRGEFEYLTYEQALERIFAQELRFKPGTDQAYSNPGYALLAAIIEKASGKIYKEYILEEIIGPAGMPHAAFFSQRDRMEEDRIALGYDGRQFGERNSPYYWVASWQNMGAGGLVMTLKELYDWRLALEDGRVLGQSAKKKFLEVYNTAHDTPWAGPVRSFAGGNDHGFNMVYVELPAHDAIVILASNTMYRRAERFVRPFIRLLLGESVEAPKAAIVIPFESRDSKGWGLPATPAGQAAAQWLNVLCGQEKAERRSFVENMYAPALFESHPLEDHVHFFDMVYSFLQATPEIHEVRTTNDRALSFQMHAAQTDERIQVVIELEAQAPHRIKKILVGD